ncbi:MAG: type-F conjugative transfer system secretin TraK [Gammaproteobacteria bacterium]
MINRLLLITILILPGSALALQVVDVVDGQTVPVKVSLKELNRISMADGARIDHIWGAEDRMRVEADKTSGQLFVRVIGAKPFSLFVRADNGETYTLLAAPKDIPAETVFLRPPYHSNQSRNSADRALPFIKRIERLMLALGRNALPEDYTPRPAPEVIPLWEEVQFERKTIYTGDTFTGEVYTLTNLTQEEMLLDERELRLLPGHPVAAVAIDKHRLRAHESTEVFVARIIRRVQP